MHGVRSAAEMGPDSLFAARQGRFWRPMGQCRKYVLDGLHYRWSWKLGAAFHSPATTLWPPLRGRCSRPAPSFPRRNFSRTRSIRNSPLGSVSRPTPGGFVIPNPFPAVNPALMRRHPASTPLWVFCTLRIEAFDRPHRTKLSQPDVRLLLTLRRVSLSITLRID